MDDDLTEEEFDEAWEAGIPVEIFGENEEKLMHGYILMSDKTYEIEMDFDWKTIGSHFMQITSEQQAEFLAGWDEAANGMDHLDEYAKYKKIPTDSLNTKSVAYRLRLLADILDSRGKE